MKPKLNGNASSGRLRKAFLRVDAHNGDELGRLARWHLHRGHPHPLSPVADVVLLSRIRNHDIRGALEWATGQVPNGREAMAQGPCRVKGRVNLGWLGGLGVWGRLSLSVCHLGAQEAASRLGRFLTCLQEQICSPSRGLPSWFSPCLPEGSSSALGPTVTAGPHPHPHRLPCFSVC